ncbi:hypothetical protein CH320_02745 [Mycoplasmopsis bovis]|nr:hypothetical protein CH320_02745 [Mycoplasmopsis bovis]
MYDLLKLLSNADNNLLVFKNAELVLFIELALIKAKGVNSLMLALKYIYIFYLSLLLLSFIKK